MWHIDEDDPESQVLLQTAVADHGHLLFWRIRRFPALAMRGRAAEARARAVARGTSTRFHVAATRDPYSFAGTPAERAAFEDGVWMPWFAFEHSRPEGGLTVMGDGMRAVVRGTIGPLRGFSISGNCEVIPALAGGERSLLGKGLGTIPKWYVDVDSNSFDGLHLSATYGCAPIVGAEYRVNATACVHPMTLARPFISPSWRSPVRDLLERCQAEIRVSHVKPTNQPAFPHILASARYCHPLGPATSDGPAPRLIVVTNVETGGMKLSVTYDTVDILDSMDDGEENGSAKTSRTGVCATVTAAFSRPHLPTLLGAAVRYYGEGVRLTGKLGWAYDPMNPAGGPAWHAAMAWQHHFQRFTVGAVATCVVHTEILPRFGVHVTYRL